MRRMRNGLRQAEQERVEEEGGGDCINYAIYAYLADLSKSAAANGA